MKCKVLEAVLVMLLLTPAIRAEQNQLPETPAQLDSVPLLQGEPLGAIRDDTAFGNWENALPDEVPPETRAEERAFWQAVVHVSLIQADIFAHAAEENRYLTFGHLYSEPGKYRGRVVHFEGRLVRLKKLDPPMHVQTYGIRALYEAWVYLDQPGTHPVCVVTPTQPAGIDVGDGLRHRVVVDGYFFKRYRYVSGRLDAAGNNVPLNTILLIGPISRSNAAAEQQHLQGSSGGMWWPWLASLAFGIVMVIGALVWQLRRSDQQVRQCIASVRAKRYSGQSEIGSGWGAATACEAPGPSTT